MHLDTTVAEIEQHVAAGGWDQPARLFALVDTADLLAREPSVAASLGLGADAEGLTPVEQEWHPHRPLDEELARIAWPSEVAGCALVREAVVLPAGADGAAPDDADVAAWAAAHPGRRDVRLVVAVLRDGRRAGALRVRDEPDLLTGPDLAPDLAEALAATLE